MWLCWKRFGSNGFAARIDKAIGHSKYLASQINARAEERGAFHLVTQPTYANCCWYERTRPQRAEFSRSFCS